jgi:hypothetical protein
MPMKTVQSASTFTDARWYCTWNLALQMRRDVALVHDRLPRARPGDENLLPRPGRTLNRHRQAVTLNQLPAVDHLAWKLSSRGDGLDYHSRARRRAHDHVTRGHVRIDAPLDADELLSSDRRTGRHHDRLLAGLGSGEERRPIIYNLFLKLNEMFVLSSDTSLATVLPPSVLGHLLAYQAFELDRHQVVECSEQWHSAGHSNAQDSAPEPGPTY